MRINHNISAMNAHRLLNANQTIGAKNLEKLSSGKRINRAGDDAAGMAITEKMRAQIKGLTMASRNSLDGVSLVQTAEGAMAEVHSMLQRMRELSVQAANGTSALSDREAIQDEINQLTSEINRVGNGTEYNTRNVLKGNEGPDAHGHVHRMSTGKPANTTGTVDVGAMVPVPGPPASSPFNLQGQSLSIFIDGEEKVVNLTGTGVGTDKDTFMDLLNDALGDSAKAIIVNSGFIEITTNSIGGMSTIDIKGGAAAAMFGTTPTVKPGVAESAAGTSQGTFYFDAVPDVGSTIKIGNETIEFFDSSKAPYIGSNRPVDLNGKTTAEAVANEIITKFGTGIDGVTITKDPKIGVNATSTGSTTARIIIKANDPGFSGNLVYLEATPKEFTTNLQVGANTGQGFRLQVGDVRSQNLKISADNPTRNAGASGAMYSESHNVTDGISSNMAEHALDVTTEEKASAAITVYNNAIVQVARERSRLGATQNRLEHTIANLDNTAENLTAAMSRIEDTDMAKEMSDFQKNNVLQQAGVSMLAQANMLPQSVLKLLG